VGLLFTDRDPASISDYFSALSPVDFARAGAAAPRTFTIPPGVVYSTGGAVAPEDDVPVQHSLEPELRRLGMPTRMVSGKVVLGADATGEVAEGAQGYTICREGDVLDSRQTRLLKLFDVCMSEFRVRLVAYWTSSTGLVTELDTGDGMEGVEKVAGDGDEASDE
jgi:mRNA turnover protein 4